MKTSKTIKQFFNYQKLNVKKNTIQNYDFVLDKFKNPCDNPALRGLFRAGKNFQFKILKIVSKVLLRHSNLSTTQRYLGKIRDAEAIRWIDHLHG